MFVRQLSPGQAFRTGGALEGFPDTPDYYTDFRLLYVSDCRAYVEPLGRVKRKITKKDEFSDLTGREETLAEFDSPGGTRGNISSGTICVPLGDDGEEDLAGPRPRNDFGPTTGGLRATLIKKPAGADIHHPPQAPQRAVRPGTVREKVLLLIKSDGKSVDRMAEKLGMKRTLFLAHVYELWNSCGYGYTVIGDKVVIQEPIGDDAGDLL